MKLFKAQSKVYKESIISPIEWNGAMIITNTSIKNMGTWIKNQHVVNYSLSLDFDNLRRREGSVDKIVSESKLDSTNFLKVIYHFSDKRDKRLSLMKKEILN
tara:strand:+ start:50 stop:355 length:306 start_codon:yes stop_codon:yes gene_type:complete